MSYVIVAGSRSYTDYQHFSSVLDQILEPDDVVVSGMALSGPDKMVLDYAEGKHLVHSFPADWERFGKKAGMLRNEQMALFADKLIAFWDGSSRGTRNMIELADEYGLEIKVIHV